MGEHTLGPWEYSGYCESDCSYHIGTVGPKSCTGIEIDDQHSMKEVVADAWAEDEHDGNALANARLISAAPDLLEACKALLNAQTTDVWNMAVDISYAAIEKAEKK